MLGSMDGRADAQGGLTMSDTPMTDFAYSSCMTLGATGIIDPLTQCSALLERKLSSAIDRNGNLSVEIAAMTQDRDKLRKLLADANRGAEVNAKVNWLVTANNAELRREVDVIMQERDALQRMIEGGKQ
jgi:hypothetical protein